MSLKFHYDQYTKNNLIKQTLFYYITDNFAKLTLVDHDFVAIPTFFGYK